MDEQQERTDVRIVCPTCRVEWVLTAAERRWFADHELFAPRRCPLCRRAKRLERFVDR